MKSESLYINKFMSSHCNQKITVSHCHYDAGRQNIQDKQFKGYDYLNDLNDVKETEDGSVANLRNVGIFR